MNTLKIEKLRNGEFIAVGKDFITFIEAANPATLALGANYTSFKTTWEEFHRGLWHTEHISVCEPQTEGKYQPKIPKDYLVIPATTEYVSQTIWPIRQKPK